MNEGGGATAPARKAGSPTASEAAGSADVGQTNNATARAGTARIAAAFARARNQERACLIAYVMGGDPNPEQFPSYLDAVAKGGADLIEIGIPFSDPVADGPTIQKASVRARAAGTRTQHVLDAARRLRPQHPDLPLIAMTYANIPFTMGWDRFARALRDAGIDGAIIPDIPVDEAAPLSAAMDAEGLSNVLLAAPTSTSVRLERIATATRGFLYLVGTLGTTGARGDLAPETVELVQRVKPVAGDANVPLAIGFGVSEPKHVDSLRAAGADGIVVGSALVDIIAHGQDPSVLEEKVRSLAAAAHGPA